MRRRTLLRGLGAGALAGLAGSGPVDAPAVAASTTASTDAAPGFAPLATLPVDGAREAVLGPDGTTVYVAAMDGFVVVDVEDPARPRLLAERRGLLPDAEGGPLRQVQEVAVDDDRLLAMGPAHPNADVVHAAVLFDVSDPAEPRQLAVHPTDYPVHNGDLVDGVAYLPGNDGGWNPLEVVAMADDATDGPRVLGRWSLVDVDPAWADVPAGRRPIHDVFVWDGVAYCSLWDAGTWLVDVSDPANPATLGSVGAPTPAALKEGRGGTGTKSIGNHHSAAVDETGDLLAVGHESFTDPAGIDLVDVSTPAEPVRLASIDPRPVPDADAASLRTTAHNFALRNGRLYSTWYHGGVRVHDVSDPAEPREVAAWRDPAAACLWTAQPGRDAIVASSMDLGSAGAGLYTFPYPSDLGTVGATAATASPSAGPAVTASPGMAGFGAAAAGAGVTLAWLLERRRRG